MYFESKCPKCCIMGKVACMNSWNRSKSFPAARKTTLWEKNEKPMWWNSFLYSKLWPLLQWFFPKKNCTNASFYYGAVPWYHNNHHSHISGHPTTPQRAEVSTTSILDFSKLDKPHWQSELGFKIPLGWVNFLRSFSADSLDLFYHKRDTWIASWCHTIKNRVQAW